MLAPLWAEPEGMSDMAGSVRMMGRLSWLAAAGCLLAGGAPAGAADLGGDCCADLEERIAELEATTARKGNRKVSLEVSGHINEAVMWWDDGLESNVYQGTNDTARSRVRFKGSAKIADGWKAGYLLEFGIRTNRLPRTDADLPSASPGTPDLRHSMWFIESERYGKVSMGQTSQASDGVTEVTTANTNHFARPSLSKWNGNFDVVIDGDRKANEWRDFMAQSGASGDNVPGEGDRRNLVRYDTAEIAGFIASAAWGEDDFWDLSLRYKGEFAGFKLAAAIGYAEYTDANLRPSPALGSVPAGSASNLRGCSSIGGVDVDCSDLGLSASIMHSGTGLFVTGAYGLRDDKNRSAIFGQSVDDTDDFWSVQAGIERKWISLGKTTVYGEYAEFNTGAGITGAGTVATFSGIDATRTRQVGSDISYWGLGINQHLEAAAMDLYLAYRHHEGDVTLGAAADLSDTASYSFESLDIVLGGAMIKF